MSICYEFSHVVEDTPEGQVVLLSGCLTEHSDLTVISNLVDGKVVLDIAGIRRVNSCGVRSWVAFVRGLVEAGHEIELRRCAPCMVRQMNMVANFASGARVLSVLAPYYCDTCGNEKEVLIELTDGKRPQVAARVPCSRCGQEMEFDDLIETYFDFLDYVQPAEERSTRGGSGT